MSKPTSTTVYGTVVTNPTKSIIKSKVDKLTGFKYPIDKEPLRGYFSKHTGKNLIVNMLKTLLRTYKGERFMLPNYGCNLKDYLMEPLDQTTFQNVRDSVYTSVKNYLKVVNLIKLQVFERQSSFGLNNVMDVKLFCSIKGETNNNIEVNIKI